MANGYKGLRMSGAIKPTNMGNMRVQKAVDFIELAERGLITGTHEQTSTAGIGHKKNNGLFGSSISSSSVDMGKIGGAYVTPYDYGSIATTALSDDSYRWTIRRTLAASRAAANAIQPVLPTSRFTATWLPNDPGLVITQGPYSNSPAVAAVRSYAMTWNSDGTKYYMFYYDDTLSVDGVNTYEVSTPYDVKTQTSGTTGVMHSPSVGGELGYGSGTYGGAQLVDGDSKLFYSNGTTLRMATLETPGDFSSTLTETQEVAISTFTDNITHKVNGITMSFDGTKVLLSFAGHTITDANGLLANGSPSYVKAGVATFAVPTAFDLTSISRSDLISITNLGLNEVDYSGREVYGVMKQQINDTGTLLWVMENSSYGSINAFSLSTPWDVNTRTKLSRFGASQSGSNTNLYGKIFNVSPDGNYITAGRVQGGFFTWDYSANN